VCTLGEQGVSDCVLFGDVTHCPSSPGHLLHSGSNLFSFYPTWFQVAAGALSIIGVGHSTHQESHLPPLWPVACSAAVIGSLHSSKGVSAAAPAWFRCRRLVFDVASVQVLLG
jgi:hypothetical protein